MSRCLFFKIKSVYNTIPVYNIIKCENKKKKVKKIYSLYLS